MRNLLPEKEKYNKSFADIMYDEFRKLSYGIASCSKFITTPKYLISIRNEIANYQTMNDGNALTDVSIRHMGWLPVYYFTEDGNCDYVPPSANMNNYQIQKCNSGPTGIGMSYVGQTGSANIIEVNAGGCVTRINVNPTINFNNNSSYEFIQNCADPQAVWYINHNLNIVPNLWAEDCNGDNISGTIDVISNNQITLTFSSPVAGKAHLS